MLSLEKLDAFCFNYVLVLQLHLWRSKTNNLKQLNNQNFLSDLRKKSFNNCIKYFALNDLKKSNLINSRLFLEWHAVTVIYIYFNLKFFIKRWAVISTPWLLTLLCM